ncbi:MAG: hypothetical protein ACM3QZ_13850 [Solirubrobacterales bacterium]
MIAVKFYRIFETGLEIDLDRLESRLAQDHSIARTRFVRIRPKSIVIGTWPLTLRLNPFVCPYPDRSLRFDVRARIFDTGSISLAMMFEDLAADPEELESIALFFAGQRHLDDPFDQYLKAVLSILEPHLGSVDTDPDFYEDYTIYRVDTLHERLDPVTVLMGEKNNFSPSIRDDILRGSLSYSAEDRAVLTWDTALLSGPDPSTDLMDLIEFANVQLLALRYYDRKLSRQMDLMYDDLASADRMNRFLRLRQYRRIMADIMELHADVSDIREKIDNLIKITEDVYYARVYETALRVLRSEQWTVSVNRKIQVIQENYVMLSNEVNIQHSNFLEWTIIVLIALEFGLAIWQAIKQ